MRPATWNDKHTETLRNRRSEGETYAEIAESLGLSEHRIKDMARKIGLATARNGSWPPEDIERLKAMNAKGMSAGQISAAMPRYTRSAVMGKLFRLKLRGHSQDQAKSKHATRALKKRRNTVPLAQRVATAKKARRAQQSMQLARLEALEAAPVPSETPPPNATSLIDLRNEQCRYPYGDEPPFLFCPDEKMPGSSYCLGHHHKSYTGIPAPPRERQQ